MNRTQARPISETDLVRDFKALGIAPGMTLVVHSSLRSVGWVLGGAPTVVRSILQALGRDGTAVMPAATPHCADPASWHEPHIPAEWMDHVREHLPVFDPRTTPTSMGAVPETFRNWPGTMRSHHPVESVCANGPLAAKITAPHPLAYSEGPDGPFGRLHELDSRILLLGVGFNRCTALHYAESLAPNRRVTTVRFPVLEDGKRLWKQVQNVADDLDTHFPVLGEQYLASGRPGRGKVGQAEAVLVDMRDLVDFAVEYFNRVL